MPELLAMIRELAEFEHLADQVVCTEDDLRRALFGPGAVVHDTVVDDGTGALAAHALWFRTFSTFLGRTGIWLEDLYVRPEHRRRGHAGSPVDALAIVDRRTARVGGARVELRGHRLLPASRGPAHGGLDALPLVRRVLTGDLQ